MRVLRPAETAAKVGLCERRLRELESLGRFTKRFVLDPHGGRAVGHLEDEVDQWIQERAAARKQAAV